MGKKEYLIFLALVFELVGLVVALVYLGSRVDAHFGKNGPGVTAGAILAIIIWVVHLVKAFKEKTPNDKT